MLVLSRKRGEKIVVPQCSLSITVVGLQGSTVRLGIMAPPDVAVHREEVWREIHTEGSEVVGTEYSPGSLDAFSAELSDAAYQIAMRHGLADSWVDLELGLWRTLATTVRGWGRKFSPPPQPSEVAASDAQSARLPR